TRFHVPDKIKASGRKSIGLRIRKLKSHSTVQRGAVLPGQLELLPADGEPHNAAGILPRQKTGRDAMTATHVRHRHPRGRARPRGTMADHLLLCLLRVFVPINKQAMMNVIAPVAAIRPGKLIVVVANVLQAERALSRWVGLCRHSRTLKDKYQGPA